MKNTAQTLHIYQHLIEISRDLASTLDLDPLLERIISAAAELSDSAAASILLYDELRNELFFQAATNLSERPQLKGISVPLESIAGWVVLNREPLMIADAHQDRRFFNQVEKKTDYLTHSIIALPMMSHNKLIGVLEVLNKQTGTYDEEDQETLMILAAQAAVAIENTRLFQQSDLISELVHEIRTPLTSINTITYLLNQPELPLEDRLRLTQTIQEETQRLTRMTTQFLDLSRLESGRSPLQLTRFDLAGLLQECIHTLQPEAERYALQVVQEIPGSLPLITADRDKIQQVILNLLSNAVKYNQHGGAITVRASAQSGWISFSVQDTGPGLRPEDQAQLFRKFFRTRSTEHTVSGTGLGLSICKRIVENHGGEISVESRYGEGSTFSVRLPL